jgi:hypothetical protein
MEKARELIAVGLWVIAVSLMIDGTIDGTTISLAWGLFTGFGALASTTWILSERRDNLRERSVGYIAEVVDALHKGKQDVSRLH